MPISTSLAERSRRALLELSVSKRRALSDLLRELALAIEKRMPQKLREANAHAIPVSALQDFSEQHEGRPHQSPVKKSDPLKPVTDTRPPPPEVPTELFLKGKTEAQISEFKKLPRLERLG